MIPPPAPEEKLIEPVMNAAGAAEVKANKATRAIRGGDAGFMVLGGELRQVKSLRLRKQIQSRTPPRSVGVPISGIAAVEDDQLNLVSVATLWVEKSHVAGVGSKLSPVRIPIPETNRKSLS